MQAGSLRQQQRGRARAQSIRHEENIIVPGKHHSIFLCSALYVQSLAPPPPPPPPPPFTRLTGRDGVADLHRQPHVEPVLARGVAALQAGRRNTAVVRVKGRWGQLSAYAGPRQASANVQQQRSAGRRQTEWPAQAPPPPLPPPTYSCASSSSTHLQVVLHVLGADGPRLAPRDPAVQIHAYRDLQHLVGVLQQREAQVQSMRAGGAQTNSSRVPEDPARAGGRQPACGGKRAGAQRAQRTVSAALQAKQAGTVRQAGILPLWAVAMTRSIAGRCTQP